MEGPTPNNPLSQPAKPPFSNVQTLSPAELQALQGPSAAEQAEYAMQREAEEKAALARRQGEVDAGRVNTSQPF